MLEWDASIGHWVYIDDGSARNLPDAFPANIWAPSKDEVYFAVNARSPLLPSSARSAHVYHGQRAAPPAQGWTWTHLDFACDHGNSLPQVWGTSSNDVYLWACKTVHHFTGDAGGDGGATAAWAAEFVDDDLDPFNPLETFGVTGSGPDDVWFVGVRGALWILGGGCTVIVHKTATGYERIVDGTAGFFTTECTAKPGISMLNGALTNLLGGTLESAGKGRALGTLWTTDGPNDLVAIEAGGEGGSSIRFARTPGVRMNGVWAASDNPVWVLADRGGVGGIVRGTNVWSDAGSYAISTLVRDGVPNIEMLVRLRGTENTLWAAGKGNVYRKTLP